MADDTRYWFPAKKYGWGWGPPTVWQGWAVFAGYFALLGGALLFIDLPRHVAGFTVYALLLTLGLIAVCWLKGEPPRWRWGK